MTPEDLVAIAQRVHERYAQIERRAYGRPWSLEMRVIGFHGDIGDLVKLVQAAASWRSFERRTYSEGPSGDLAVALRHELTDCLWSLIVISDLGGAAVVPVVSAALASAPDGSDDPIAMALRLCAAAGSLAAFAELADGQAVPAPSGMAHPWQSTLERCARAVGALAQRFDLDLGAAFVPAMQELLTRSTYDPKHVPSNPILS